MKAAQGDSRIALMNYSPEEIQAFHQAVKKDIYPLYIALSTLFNSEYDVDIYYADYTGDIAPS